MSIPKVKPSGYYSLFLAGRFNEEKRYFFELSCLSTSLVQVPDLSGVVAFVQPFSGANHPNAQIVHPVVDPGLERSVVTCRFTNQSDLFDFALGVGNFLCNI
jgi:hypothetical protein